jgi:small subunit ribosomal protein S20
LSSKKRIRQTLKRRARNRARKELLREQVKAFQAALTGGDVAKAETEFRKAASRLDRTAAKGTIHKKTASRRRSRLARKLNALRASGGAKPETRSATKRGARTPRKAASK